MNYVRQNKMKIIWQKFSLYEEDDEDSENITKLILPQENSSQRLLSSFNFWLGHTDEKITKRIFNIIDNCDGVEILNLISQYRFVIAIGHCFDERDVKKTIEVALGSQDPEIPPELLEVIYELRQDLNKFKNWVICIVPNGEIDATYDEDEEFREKLSIFEEASECGCLLINK